MVIDNSEIDSLLSQADQFVGEATEAAETAPGAACPTPGPTPERAMPFTPDASPELARILRLRVPVIVRLAQRRLTTSNVRGLSCGGIIEFDRSVGEPLDLLINNRCIGRGEAVKVGENFGLRVLEIEDQEHRIKSMAR